MKTTKTLKAMKRILSAILAAALCLGCANAAFANDTEPVVGELLHHPETDELFAVLTYDRAYTQTGDLPEVEWRPDAQTCTTLPAEDVLPQILCMEPDDTDRFAQLFIRLPETDASLLADAELYVGAGAFRDADGNEAPAVQQRIGDCTEAAFDMYLSTPVSIEERRFMPGAPIDVVLYGVGKLGAVWEVCNTLSMDPAEPEEGFMLPENAQKCTVTCRLNAFIWDEYTFIVDAPCKYGSSKNVSENLRRELRRIKAGRIGKASLELLASPFKMIGFLLFAPIAGLFPFPMIGVMGVMSGIAAFAEIPLAVQGLVKAVKQNPIEGMYEHVTVDEDIRILA